MKTLIVAASFFFAVGGFCQSPSGSAATTGPCSPAVSGSNNKTNFTCVGLDPKLTSQLLELMNRVATNQLDAQAVMSKLDGCLAQLKSVREQQEPWHLTVAQKSQFVALLPQPPELNPAKVTVAALGGDRNASLVAVDLIGALRERAWMDKTSAYSSDFTINPQVTGIVLVTTHDEFPQAFALAQALKSAGIKFDVVIDKDKHRVRDDNEIQIVIGARPNPQISEADR